MPIITTIRGTLRVFGKARSIGSGSTGGTITTAGGYRIHTFTTVGTSTFTPDAAGEIQYLIVAGGAGGYGFGGGGGGAGGMLSGTTVVSAQSYSLIVGAGGTASGINATNGSDSSALGFTAIGGGIGGFDGSADGKAGGSGGGAGTWAGGRFQPGGSPTSGQGNAGGSAADYYYAGGGGGAGSAGENAGASGPNGNGGSGLANSISGSSVFYAGGGGGACRDYNVPNGRVTSGGSGGGGQGSGPSSRSATAGTNGLGGGGGGNRGYYDNTSPAVTGGSGVIIVRYPI